MSKKVVGILILTLLLLGVVIGVFLVKNRQIFRSKAFEDSRASFILTASSDKISQGEEFRLSLSVRSDLFPTNLFVAKLSFPKDQLEVVKIETEGSFIDSWVEQYFDNEGGEVSLIGGLPSPGLRTKSDKPASSFASLLFKAKGQGAITLALAGQSAIYQDLDNTDILDSSNQLDLNIAQGSKISDEARPIFTLVNQIVAGTAYVEGELAQSGSLVEVFCQLGTVSGKAKVETQDGKFRLTVFGQDSNSPGSGSYCAKGQKMKFRVNNTEVKTNVKLGTDQFDGGLGSAALIDLE